jgi:hypothetical protein
MKPIVVQIVFITAFASMFEPCNAQLTVSGQVRPRAEFRSGQGSPSVQDTAAAFFISQRTRVNLGMAAYRMKAYVSLQDVRVWGQDASTINRTTTEANDGLLLHEAWAEFSLLDTGRRIKNFTLKAGRQELVYDDVRLLGNLDWLQQARRHDALLLKLEHNGWTAHAGAAFNQNAERKSNTVFDGTSPSSYPASTNGQKVMYKSMQFLYLARKEEWGSASFLFFKDDFSRFHFAAADTLRKSPIYEAGVWSRFTSGLYLNAKVTRRLSIASSAYYQGGQYAEGTVLHEYLLSFSTLYSVFTGLSGGPGIDITSGNNGSDPSKKFARFDPLYGTPHKFWGYMDYFYVADGFGPNGLVDLYLRTRYKPGERLTVFLDAHRFSLPQAVMGETGDYMKKLLGTEIDLMVTHQLTKMASLEGGLSWMFGTETLTSSRVKNVPGADRVASWAYVMLTLKPEFMLGSK